LSLTGTLPSPTLLLPEGCGGVRLSSDEQWGGNLLSQVLDQKEFPRLSGQGLGHPSTGRMLRAYFYPYRTIADESEPVRHHTLRGNFLLRYSLKGIPAQLLLKRDFTRLTNTPAFGHLKIDPNTTKTFPWNDVHPRQWGCRKTPARRLYFETRLWPHTCRLAAGIGVKPDAQLLRFFE